MEQCNQINNQFKISDRQIKLLDLVGKAYYAKQTIFVGDLISQKHIASQATIHADLKKLICKKLLFAKICEKDGRVKSSPLRTELYIDNKNLIAPSLVNKLAC